jgi:acetyl esterase/lipase
MLKRASLGLAALNVLTPRPSGVRRRAALSYGPLPRHRLDLYAPKTKQDRRPLLVFIHGGGWETGRREEYAFAGRAYAAQGFVTAVPDYRLTGHAPFPAFLEDCAGAVAWCQAQAESWGADAARTVLAGHSAGAYNVAMLALDARWLARAGATQPVRGWAGLSGPYDFLPLEPGPGLRTFGAAPDAPGTQPIAYVGADSPPAYLATGEADAVVRPRNTQRLAERLRASGVRVEERIYPNVDHAGPLLALTWPFRRRLPVLAETTAFLRAASAPDAPPQAELSRSD